MNTLQMPRNPITNSMIPMQGTTRQACAARGEFSPDYWRFDLNRTFPRDYQSSVPYITSNQSFFTKTEPHQTLESTTHGMPTGDEPVYGHMKYIRNPLDQEQTNGHSIAFKLQGVSRVQDNMNPIGSMRYPPYQYPYLNWTTIYNGSTSKLR